MKNAILEKILCIFLAMCFLLPISELTTDSVKADGETKSEVKCWREGESWDWSWDTNSSKNWVIETEGDAAQDASDGTYTDVINVQHTGDYARWDFYVNESDTYKFWIRGYHTILYQGGCDDVRLYWETNSSSTQIGSFQNWHNVGGWTWTAFGYETLDSGIGTLVIESYETGWLAVDKILITNNFNYTPTDEGNEVGSISHVIGEPLTMNPGNELADIDEEYIESNTWTLSHINSEVEWSQYGYGIPMGRFFGTAGERLAATYIKGWFDTLDIHSYKEPIAAYPNPCIDDLVEVHSKGFNYKLSSGGSIKQIDEFFIGPQYNLSYAYWLKNKQNWISSWWDMLSYNCSHSNLKIIDRKNTVFGHTFNDSFDDVIDNFLETYQDDILSDLETYITGRSSNDFNNTFDYIVNITSNYFEQDQSQINNFTFEEYDPSDPDTYPDFFNGEYIPACIDSDYVFIEEDPWNNPELEKLLFFRESGFPNFTNRFIYYYFLTRFHVLTRCQGFILYDFNTDCYNMVNTRMMALPLIFINGTIGADIINNGTSVNN